MRIHCTYSGIRGILNVASMHHNYTTMITSSCEERMKILSFWWTHGYSATYDAFQVSERTLYSWQSRLRASSWQLVWIKPHSQAPKNRRKRSWSPKVLEYIQKLREEHPNIWKEKIHPLLNMYCAMHNLTCPKISTIGRLMKDLWGLRKYPQKVYHNGRIGIKKKNKVLRKPKDFQAKYPWHMVAFDTIIKIVFGTRYYCITAIDIYSRTAFSLVVSWGRSIAAKEFFEAFQKLFPFKIQQILTDNGSEFKKHFHKHICELHKTHYHTYPRTPKMNAHNERFNRTIQEEFINHHTHLLATSRDTFNTKLMDYLLFYNTQRVHHAFKNKKTPLQILLEYYNLHNHCRNGWTYTNICIPPHYKYTIDVQ